MKEEQIEELIADMEWYFQGTHNNDIPLSGLATHLVNKGYRLAPPVDEKLREEVAKLLYFKAGGDGWDKEPDKPKHYLDLGKEMFRRTADQILSLFQSAQAEAVRQERISIAHILRLLEEWGQLNVKDFPLITAALEKLEQGQAPSNEGKQIEKGSEKMDIGGLTLKERSRER